MLYLRFIICLAVGLLGLSLLLKTLLDVLFTDWDFFGEARAWMFAKNKKQSPYAAFDAKTGRVPAVGARRQLPQPKRSEQFLAPPDMIDPHVELAPPPTLAVRS